MTNNEIWAIFFLDFFTRSDYNLDALAAPRSGAAYGMLVGIEWLIEATGCNADALRDESRLRSVFDRAIADLGLKSVGAVWHKFPGEGGVTGLVALTESHLACHTYPEYGTATFNLYCCRERPEWDWEGYLQEALGASHVNVTRFERGEGYTNARTPLEFEISDLRSEIGGGAA